MGNLSHPETTATSPPSQSVEKLSFKKLAPGAKTVWNHWSMAFKLGNAAMKLKDTCSLEEKL